MRTTVINCDWCKTEISDDGGPWVIDVNRYGLPEDTCEAERELCGRCMAKLRPILDLIDGKAKTG